MGLRAERIVSVLKPKTEKSCAECGAEVRTAYSHKRFCSKPCSLAWRKKASIWGSKECRWIIDNPVHAQNGKDITGRRSGSLVALSVIVGRIPRRWDCLCDCGNHANVLQGEMISGCAKSCGCQGRGRPRTGLSRSLDVTCEQCGKEFRKMRAKADQRFCSQKCGGESRRGNPTTH